jgi:hypothetical protein
MVRIDVLYFDGCPSCAHAWSELGLVLASERLDASVRLLNVVDLDDSALHGFAGSPTIRVNGRDLEGYDGPAVMACRRYADNGGRGWPSRRVITRAVRAAREADGATGGTRPS